MSGLMVLYPFVAVYWYGEGVHTSDGKCGNVYGYWRVVHLSHLLLWGILFAFLVMTFPQKLVVDKEREAFRYVMLMAGQEVVIPFDTVKKIEKVGPELGGYGYVRITTTMFPFLLRPSSGADAFIDAQDALFARRRVGDAAPPAVGKH